VTWRPAPALLADPLKPSTRERHDCGLPFHEKYLLNGKDLAAWELITQSTATAAVCNPNADE